MSVFVQRLFDGIAPRYDTLNHLLSAGRDKAWRKRAATLAALVDCVEPPQILDLCGGTGDFLRAVRRELTEKNRQGLGVVGDFSLPMLKMAKSKFTPNETQVSRVGVDALHLPFRPAVFNAIFCGYGIRNLDDWRQGIRHIHAALKPGGTFVTLEFFRPETAFTRFFYGALAPLAIPFIGGLMSRKEAYRYLVESIQAFAPVSSYAQACREAGFSSVAVEACDLGVTHIVVARKSA